MIKSMTGFGKAEQSSNGKNIRIEIRSLNSKFLDLNLRMPNQFRDNEMMLRNLMNEKLERGKVDCMIFFEDINSSSFAINTDLAIKYLNELTTIAVAHNQSTEFLLASVLKMPEVMKPVRETNKEDDWNETFRLINTAIDEFQKFRTQEGNALQKILEQNVLTILQLLTEAEQMEGERMQNIKTRIGNSLEEFIGSEKIDKNRFEQEMIYYLEKLDVSEEKSRLKHHCEFFIKTMNETQGGGRKLGFICQEIGREINTLGSKANHAGIQKVVVQMKDELEKMKEQLLNIL